MNARFNGRPGIKQSDDTGECGARIGDADDGAARGKFIRDQEAAGAGSRGRGGGLSISDECDLVAGGRFKRSGGRNFKRAIAIPRSFQMIRNI